MRKKYPLVDIREIAVSNAAGEATFHHYEGQSAYNSLRPNLWMQTGVVAKTVTCARLDDQIPLDRHVGLIKLDVEGAEYAALQGAEAVINRCRPAIIFECTRGGLDAFSLAPAHLFDFFTDREYSIFTFQDWIEKKAPLSSTRFGELQQPIEQAQNFLAMPKSRK